MSPADDKKVIQIVSTTDAQELWKALCDEAGISQGIVFRYLLETVQLVAGIANESGAVPEGTKISALELYITRTLHMLGLLADSEFERAIQLGDAMEGKRADLRLNGLAAMANERMDQLRPIWEVSRAEAEARRAAEWNPQVAALKQAIAKNVVSAMEAAHIEAKYQEAAQWDGRAELHRVKAESKVTT